MCKQQHNCLGVFCINSEGSLLHPEVDLEEVDQGGVEVRERLRAAVLERGHHGVQVLRVEGELLAEVRQRPHQLSLLPPVQSSL